MKSVDGNSSRCRLPRVLVNLQHGLAGPVRLVARARQAGHRRRPHQVIRRSSRPQRVRVVVDAAAVVALADRRDSTSCWR
jgi:hypothetical protein